MTDHDHKQCDHDHAHDKVPAMAMMTLEEVRSTVRVVDELHMGLMYGIGADEDVPLTPQQQKERALIMTMVHTDQKEEDEKTEYFALAGEQVDHFFQGMCTGLTESTEEAKLLYESFYMMLRVLTGQKGE